jgi:hypothetical protein
MAKGGFNTRWSLKIFIQPKKAPEGSFYLATNEGENKFLSPSSIGFSSLRVKVQLHLVEVFQA